MRWSVEINGNHTTCGIVGQAWEYRALSAIGYGDYGRGFVCKISKGVALVSVYTGAQGFFVFFCFCWGHVAHL